MCVVIVRTTKHDLKIMFCAAEQRLILAYVCHFLNLQPRKFKTCLQITQSLLNVHLTTRWATILTFFDLQRRQFIVGRAFLVVHSIVREVG